MNIGDEELADIIDTLKELVERYSPTYHRLYLEKEYCGYDGGYEVNLMGTRKETDTERNKRLAKERKKQEKKQKQKENRIERVKKEAVELGLLSKEES
jgi:tRNA/tmRNA/rRNA uracil-C5-methylase (TrmA/RlmC/RlmD family)